MVTDAGLTPLARVVGVVLATKHLNRVSGEAWPAIGTLASLVGRGVTQVTAALDALEQAGHLEISRTKGGQKQTNRYRPLLKPLGNPRGKAAESEGNNPSEIRDGTPRKSDGEPLGFPRGNPFEEPIDEPRDGHPARPMGLRSTVDGSGSAPGGASPTRYQRGEVIEIDAIIENAWERTYVGQVTVERARADHVLVRDNVSGSRMHILVRGRQLDLEEVTFLREAGDAPN